MTATAEKQEFDFQAETRQLLHLLSHSLYQNRDVAIRELVSNASDALDKFRHLSLTDESLRDDVPLEIVVEADADKPLLVIRDNGIGMTRDELVENLGTIAHSGSMDFLKNLTGDSKKDVSLIGQFGVGFYSAFMLADRVEVFTRSYREDAAWRWESDGTGRFSVESAESRDRGTEVRLHLNENSKEFAETTRLRHVLSTYSTFVPHPLKLGEERVNDQPPIWVEPKSQLKEEQYHDFYQYLTHRTDEKPLTYLHVSADSPLQFHAILYCPPTNFERLGFGRSEHGLHLCAKRILVQSDCRDLLPEYLRFLYGLVDSDDLPLNISRDSLQDNSVFRKIGKVLTKRLLDHLKNWSTEKPNEYLAFYEQFGSCLREGVATDFENRDRVAALLRFASSHSSDPKSLTSLDEYVERAGDGQKEIYFVGGPDRASIEQNPNLEIFRKNSLEVLYLSDPIDEFALTSLGKYKDMSLKSIDAADVELPDAAEDEKKDEDEKDKSADETPSGFGRVLDLFREALGDRVVEVRQSKRLTDSPCCLVHPQGGMSSQLEQILQTTHQEFASSKRILEVNPHSALIKRLSQLTSNADHDEFIRESGRQLFANTMILEGLAPDGQEMVSRVQTFLEELAEKRSPIVT